MKILIEIDESKVQEYGAIYVTPAPEKGMETMNDSGLLNFFTPGFAGEDGFMQVKTDYNKKEE